VQTFILNLAIAVVLFPLLGAIIAGFFSKQIGCVGTNWATICGIGLSLLCSIILFKLYIFDRMPSVNESIYTWGWGWKSSSTLSVGFLIDSMTVLMMVTVNAISLMVHIYSIGYMSGDPGYQRFFVYMSLFTFFMLVLTSANNFLLLFFGWEGVGLVSYLLIGFWFEKESAVAGGLKAFLVNRVGDFGFLLGIAAIFGYFGSLDYATVFTLAPSLSHTTISILPGINWSLLTLICILLFVGAMGKSAQIPLHVWLPESMEGPTPISALIHAATMVTAGVYMVARMSPLFELSTTALSVVLLFGAVGALFLGILALVENDIKRVIAYSTMSQLGYMMAANGASAYSAGMFHLVTHAFFKALLFLAAGAVIIALHHEQNMQKMGNLRKYLPITYVTFLIGALSLSAIPPFSGFYSKDSIIEAVQMAAQIPGAHFAYICLLVAVFVTSLYIFRAFFLTFHGKGHYLYSKQLDFRLGVEKRAPGAYTLAQEDASDENNNAENSSALSIHEETIKEPGKVMLVPLILLSIPSLLLGLILVKPMLFAHSPILRKSIYVAPATDVLAQMSHEFHGAFASIFYAFFTLPFWLALAGIVCAWLFYVRIPDIPGRLQSRFSFLHKIMVNKYGFDTFNDVVFVRGGQKLSNILYRVADMKVIDSSIVNGSGRGITFLARLFRHTQSGYLYHYAFVMILGLFVLLVWMLLG
jgi:NADH-quinone oxidoreductase subunit L